MTRPCRAAVREQGGAAVAGVLVVGVLGVVALFVGAVGGAVADQRRVESAADLAALAAAGAVQEGRDACESADTTARRNGGRLAGCQVTGETVTVRVERRTQPVLGRRLTLSGSARAGPVRR